MKYKSIHIRIPSPCHESWEGMGRTERGAFCHSCQTEVIDFSRMTDRELIEYLSKNNVNCGRYRSDQVDTKLTIPEVKNGFLKWRAFLLSILSLAAFKNASAKPSIPHQTIQQCDPQKKEADDTHIPLPDTITVHGTVLNEAGIGSQNAIIELLDSTGYITGVRTETDSTGHFTIVLTGLSNKNYLLQLSISHWTYRSKTVTLNNDLVQYVAVRLDEHVYYKMGKKAR